MSDDEGRLEEEWRPFLFKPEVRSCVSRTRAATASPAGSEPTIPQRVSQAAWFRAGSAPRLRRGISTADAAAEIALHHRKSAARGKQPRASRQEKKQRLAAQDGPRNQRKMAAP